MTPICPYCRTASEFVSSIEVYDRHRGMIYLCRSCGAYVGVHKETSKPLGRLANAELRQKKQMAHKWFDRLWRAKIRRTGVSKTVARRAGYKWLAKQMGIDRKKCHIGMFDEEQCMMVVYICSKYRVSA